MNFIDADLLAIAYGNRSGVTSQQPVFNPIAWKARTASRASGRSVSAIRMAPHTGRWRQPVFLTSGRLRAPMSVKVDLFLLQECPASHQYLSGDRESRKYLHRECIRTVPVGLPSGRLPLLCRQWPCPRDVRTSAPQ